jgi:hypothetical protein
MGVPKNIIIPSKYTSGGDFVNAATNAPYQGYYYEYQNGTYAGQEFNPTASQIIKIDSPKQNKLLNSLPTAIYSLVSGITSQTLSKPAPQSLSSVVDQISDRPTRFFYKKYNDNIIKEIDENGYKSLQSQPIYQITFIGTYQGKTQSIEQAESQLPGIKSFLAG